MKSTRKTPRTSKTTHLVNRDRLSNLPKDILHYILSFLETREVIRLSELARRWRRAWASMPYLNFEQSSFDSAESFSDFLWLVLLFRDVSDIKRFRLSCEGYREDGIPVHLLKTLLLVVKNRGVVVLDLDIATFQYQYDNNFQLLSCFADCRSLPEINLRLFDYSQLSCIDSMSFTMLKTLHIEKSQFYQGVTYREKLVLCCPHLENFLLKNCNMLNLKVIDIEAVNLKNLKFMNTSKYPFRGELKISAPNLRCLSYLGPTLKGYSFQNLSSLNKALIHHFTERVNNEEDGCFLLSLVCALYNAEVLYLSSHFAQHLSHLTYKERCFPPTFLRLKSLTLSIGLRRRNIKGLVHLLKYSPILEALRIDFEEQMKNRKLEDTNQTHDMKRKLQNTKWKLRDTKLKDTTLLQGLKCESSKEMLEHKVTCLTHHLKKVEINSFVWKKIASKLVKYLLKNGKVLEKITISCRDYVLGNKRFARKLGASPNVSISFPSFMERKPLWFEVEDDGSDDDSDDGSDDDSDDDSDDGSDDDSDDSMDET